MAGLTSGAAAAVLANVTRVGVLDTGVAMVSGTIQDRECERTSKKKKNPRQRGSTVCWQVVDIVVELVGLVGVTTCGVLFR